MSADRRARILITAGCLLALFLMAAGTDLVLWRVVERGAAPIKAITLDDQEYYILRARAAVMDGGPVGSSSYSEHRHDPSHYFIFETLLAMLGRPLAPFVGTGAVLWANLLRVLTAFAIFFAWSHVFRAWMKVSAAAAAVAAACIVLWQMPFALHVQYALGSWLLPFVFAGFICAVAGQRSERPVGRVGWSLGASLLFSVHPVAFAVGAVATGFLWIAAIVRRRDRSVVLEASSWGIPTLLFGLALFGATAFPDAGSAATVAETMSRFGAMKTHLPAMPLSHLRTLALLGLIFILRRRDEARRHVYDALMAFTAAAALGLSANIVTGSYFLGDHYAFFEGIAAVMIGVLAATAPPNDQKAEYRGLTIACAAVFVAYAAALLIDHPIRSWLSLGVNAPYFLGLAVAIRAALGGRRPSPPTRTLIVAVIIASLLYPALFLWRLERGLIPTQRMAEETRPLLERLASLPKGVVMADADVSALVAMNTDDLPYWVWHAHSDQVSNEELVSRWTDELVLFAEQPWVRDDRAQTAIFGVDGLFCGSLSERLVYAPLTRAGVIGQSLCRRTLSDDAWKDLARTKTADALTERAGGSWAPSYRLDYLVIDRAADEGLPTSLASMFQSVWDDGRFAIYRFTPKP